MPYKDREKNVEYNRKYYAANKLKWRKYRMQWHNANPGRSAELMRKYMLKANYGLTPEGYEQLLSEQCGRCAICGTEDPGGVGKRLHVDHCHTTGVVRGLLCAGCNTRLGWLEKNKDQVLEYLNQTQTRGVA